MKHQLRHPHLVILALLLTLLLALLPACFDAAQRVSADGHSLLLGLPFAFYTIYATPAGTFAVHLGVGGLFADFLIIYGILWLGMRMSDKWKGVQR